MFARRAFRRGVRKGRRLPISPFQWNARSRRFRDLVSHFWRLYRTVTRQIRPTIVDASTPKAGLLTGAAAWLGHVPCRVYTLRGLRLETARGVKRAILWVAEWLACTCAHRVVCVSPSLRARAIGPLKLVSPEKATVLAKGSGGSRRLLDSLRRTGDRPETEKPSPQARDSVRRARARLCGPIREG